MHLLVHTSGERRAEIWDSSKCVPPASPPKERKPRGAIWEDSWFPSRQQRREESEEDIFKKETITKQRRQKEKTQKEGVVFVSVGKIFLKWARMSEEKKKSMDSDQEVSRRNTRDEWREGRRPREKRRKVCSSSSSSTFFSSSLSSS